MISNDYFDLNVDRINHPQIPAAVGANNEENSLLEPWFLVAGQPLLPFWAFQRWLLP